MGIIRKTLSISTLGMVSFRSKKELLQRAERARRDAEAELDRQQSARADADRRVAEAERRVKLAELTALREAKSAAKSRRRGERRRGRRFGEAREVIEDLVASTQPAAHDAAEAVGRRARRAAKRARRAAVETQEELGRRGRRARKRMRDAEAVMAPKAEAAKERAMEIKDEVVDLTSTAMAEARDRLEDARGRD